MLKVLITIDTEVHPARPQWREDGLQAEIDQYLYGRTPQGDFGLGYQLSTLGRLGLRAVFFVEALAASEMGIPFLSGVVEKIRAAGHEVQLQLHTEWLGFLRKPLLGGRTGLHMREFSDDDQSRLIAEGLGNLRSSGVDGISAFRAGNYGADERTLRALSRNGLRFDSSWNAPYVGSACGIDAGGLLVGPKQLHGLWEIPIAFFEDYPGHHRHAQLAACTFEELRFCLGEAHRRSWPTFVIVFHSFELVWRGVAQGRAASPRRLVIRRFERLCHFLADNRDRFQTVGFSDLSAPDLRYPEHSRPLRSSLLRTAHRYAEQLAGRFL